MRKEKITVWHMNGVMNAGGTESLIMNILRHQSQAISHVLVIHSQVNEVGVYDAELDALGIKVLRLPVIGQVGIKAYTEAFNQLIISEGQPDIIHSHLNAVGGVIAKVAKKNHIDARIIHCHADIKFRGSTINTLIQESKLALMKILVNKYGNYYFAASQAAGNRLFYKNKQVTIINNAIDSERYLCTPTKIRKAKNNLGVTKESFIIGGIGRIVPIKNYEVILKAIPTLVENGCQPLFVCYGRVADEHYFKQLTSLVEALGIEDYVQFKGNSQNIAEDIAAFDTFVLPSITEGLGIVAIEAQAAGKKCVVSTGVPVEVDMGLDLIKQVEPSNEKQWAAELLKCAEETVTIDNQTILNHIQLRGFDMTTEISHIEGHYHKIAEETNEKFT